VYLIQRAYAAPGTFFTFGPLPDVLV
jgi:hypothetical protein